MDSTALDRVIDRQQPHQQPLNLWPVYTRRDLGATRLLMVVVAVVAAAIGVIAPGQAAHAASTVYVAPWGSNDASGTRDDPVQTVTHAVWRARSGDSIVLRDGVYREDVQIYGKTIHLASEPNERAILDGSVPLDGWQQSDEDWFVDGWTRQFPATRGVPVDPDSPVAGYPDQVFFDGKPLEQVLLRSEVEPGTFFHDTSRDRIYIGDNPAGALVESSELSWGLYFNNADGSSLTNITVRRFATPAARLAALRIHSNDVTVSGVTSEFNAGGGVSVIGDEVVIRSSRFSDNGFTGVHAHKSSELVVQDSAIVGNNKAGFDQWHSAGGLKVTESTNATIRGNNVSRNAGPGIWTDLSVTWSTISYNQVEGNGRSGIQVELSSNINVVSNVILTNGEAGVWVLESTDVQIAHNASYENLREVRVLEGPRRAVNNIRIINNVLGDSRGGRSLVQVDDWTHQRSAHDMGVEMFSNAYWLPSSSPVWAVSQWSNWPTRTSFSYSLQQHRHTTDQGDNSVVSYSDTNPYANDSAAGDYRAPASMRSGVEVAGWLATELGVPAGSELPIGPTEVPPTR